MTSNSSLVAHGSPTEFFTFASLTALGVPNATTTKHCPGIGSFAEPIVPEAPKPPFRDEAVAALGAAGLSMSQVGYARQVHGADIALSQLTPTEERDVVLDFSDEYLSAPPGVLARAGVKASDEKGLRGLRWVVPATLRDVIGVYAVRI